MNTGKKALYQDVEQTVNQALGRKAITVHLIAKTVDEARRVRQSRGAFALITYMNQWSERYFTSDEVEQLKAHPRRRELTNRMLDHLVKEGVVTYPESTMLKRLFR